MKVSVFTLTVAGVLCGVLALVGGVGAQSGNGDPGDSWAEQRADGGLDLSIKLSPQTVNFGSKTLVALLTVHTDILYSCVDVGSLALSGIPVRYAFADDRGNLVAKFSMEAVMAIVSPPSAELTLTGITHDGVGFAGFAILQVLEPRTK